jgi:hypothetical protein
LYDGSSEAPLHVQPSEEVGERLHAAHYSTKEDQLEATQGSHLNQTDKNIHVDIYHWCLSYITLVKP